MSLSVALTNAMSGLRLNQAALDVAAQNVANVNTEGYSRKIIQQQTMVLGGLGSGVQITQISRNVNEFVLKDMRASLSQVSDTRVQDEFYARMQNLFGSLNSDTSISAFVSNLATRFQTLVNAPEDVALRSEVVAQADLLAQQFRMIASEIQDMRLAADRSINDGVSEIQTQLTKVNELNIKIAEHKALGLPLTDLQDQRDMAVNNITEQMGVNYFQRNTGEMVLMTEAGRLMVDRTVPTITHTPASTFDNLINWNGTTGAVDGINMKGIDITSEISTGRLAGLIQMRDTLLPNLASQMEELSSALQNEINALHNQGTSFPGNKSLTGTRTMLGTEQPLWTGNFRVAALDSAGAVVESLDINLAGVTTVNDLITQINGMTEMTATLTAGKVVIQPTNAVNRVAVNELTSAVTLGNRTVGASTFLGLNDLFVNGADYDIYGSDYQASRSTALGIAGTMTVRAGATNVAVAYVATDTLSNIATKINTAMTGAGLAVTALADNDGSGYRLRLTTDTNTGLQNIFLSDAPSTPTGVVSFLNMTVRDGRMASTMTVRADIKTDPSRLAQGQLGSGVLAVGADGITSGDNKTVEAIANKFNSELTFSPTGLLSGSKRTLAQYGAQILALNASQARNIADLRSSREFLVENLTNTVASASGVNLDEEMANLVVLQNAYAASARVIDITSQMFDALAQIIR